MAKIVVQNKEITVVPFNCTEFDTFRNAAGSNNFAVLINDGMPQGERLIKLNQIAIQQMRVLEDIGSRKLLK